MQKVAPLENLQKKRKIIEPTLHTKPVSPSKVVKADHSYFAMEQQDRKKVLFLKTKVKSLQCKVQQKQKKSRT